MKAWLNVYDTPTGFTREPDLAINSELTLSGFYPGNGFFLSKEAAERAVALAAVEMNKRGQGARWPVRCIEVEISDPAVADG